MTGVFISYRGADTGPTAGRIGDRLRDRFGSQSVFMDTDPITAGMDFAEYIDKTLKRCQVILAIIGPRWLDGLSSQSDRIRLELENALAGNIRVIPVLIDGTEMPIEDMLPKGMQKLARRQPTKLDTGEDFLHHVQRLTDAVATYCVRRRIQSALALATAVIGFTMLLITGYAYLRGHSETKGMVVFGFLIAWPSIYAYQHVLRGPAIWNNSPEVVSVIANLLALGILGACTVIGFFSMMTILNWEHPSDTPTASDVSVTLAIVWAVTLLFLYKR